MIQIVARHSWRLILATRALTKKAITRSNGRIRPLPGFDNLDSLPTPPESAWPTIKEQFPVGSGVSGLVIARRPFGVFLDLGRGALGLMERPSMPWQPGGDRMASPDLGTELRGTVVDYMENNRQIRVVADDPWIHHQDD